MYYNLNGTLKEGYIYLNGKVTQHIRTPTKSELFELKKIKKMQKYSFKNLVDFRSSRVSSTNNSTSSSSSCDWYLVDYYWKECSGVPITCSYEYRSSEYLYLCDGSGNELPIDFIDPGEGGGGDTAIVIDCNNVVNGEAFYNRDCNTCIGGDTGVTGCPSDLIDSLQGYDCARDLLAAIPNFKDQLSETITGMFGRSEYLNIVFKPDNSFIGTNIDGSFDGPLRDRAPGIRSYQVTFNPDVLLNSSKEFIIATMYHEALHAYLFHMKAILGSYTFQQEFGSLSMNNGRLVPLDTNHIVMSYFVNDIAGAILDFNPSFGLSRAKALAKNGVVYITEDEDDINKAERNTNSTAHGVYQGTKCP